MISQAESKIALPGMPPPPPLRRKGIRLTIGGKLLSLLLVALLVTIISIVQNATQLFKKDNLDSIYLSSDLLTGSKGAQIRTWLDSLIRKGVVLSWASKESGKSARPFLTELENDRDLLFSMHVACDPGSHLCQSAQPWWNRALGNALQFPADAMNELKPTIDRLYEATGPWNRQTLTSSPTIEAHSISLLGKSIILLSAPGVSEIDGERTLVVVGLLARNLGAILSETGPYSLVLVNQAGKVLGAKENSPYSEGTDLSKNPLFQRLNSSGIERELHEYVDGGQERIGAYHKLGIGNLSLLSEIRKSVALETGDLLVKRSILIALIAFSIVFILVYLALQGIVSPVRKLNEAAKAISRGNYQNAVSVNSRDEISDLADSFSTMGREIKRRIIRLSRINDGSKTIASTLDPQKLIEYTLEFSLSLTDAYQGMAWYDSQPDAREPSPKRIALERGWTLALNPDELKARLENPEVSTIVDLEGRSALISPIREREVVRGYVVLLKHPSVQGFEKEDTVSIEAVMSNVGVALDNIRLLKDTAEKTRLEKEIETAKHVQSTMFPPEQVTFPGLDISSFYTPASECGGDWWGCGELGDGKKFIAIGDATGHGLPAAMITATAKAACSVIAAVLRSHPGSVAHPSEMLELLNGAVYEATQGKILMTFFIGVIDAETRKITYASASHDPIYIYRAGGIGTDPSRERLGILLAKPGPRLGQGPQAHYEQSAEALAPGDLIITYTDGVTEASNAEGKEYSERKFMRSIVKHSNRAGQELRDGLLSDLREFTGSTPLKDDVTLAVVQIR